MQKMTHELYLGLSGCNERGNQEIEGNADGVVIEVNERGNQEIEGNADGDDSGACATPYADRVVACVNACENITTGFLCHLPRAAISRMASTCSEIASAAIADAEQRGINKASEVDEQSKQHYAQLLQLIDEAVDNIEARQIIGAHVDDEEWIKDWQHRAAKAVVP